MSEMHVVSLILAWPPVTISINKTMKSVRDLRTGGRCLGVEALRDGGCAGDGLGAKLIVEIIGICKNN